MPRDPYDVLAVSRTATEEEIKKSYRKLAREFHPDRNPGDKAAESKFKEVQEAFAILSDKNKKQQFDQFGHAGDQGNNPFPGGFPGGGGAGMEDILSSLFGGRTPRSGGKARRPAPQQEPAATEVMLEISLELADKGGKQSFQLNGKDLQVTIPPGFEEGKRLRLKGQGSQGGDLLIQVRFAAHSWFRREGPNLILDVPLTLREAAVGAKVEVPNLQGEKLTVKIPAGASGGQRLRLKGMGLAGGDLFIEMKVVVPAVRDGRGVELLAELEGLYPQAPRAELPWNH